MIDRLKMGYQFNLLFPGPRMIWQMGELGYDVSINFNGRTGEKPVKWDYFSNDKRRELYNQVVRIFNLRNQYSLYTVAPDYGNIGLGAGNIVTPRRMMLNDGSGHYVISVANLDPAAAHVVTPGFPATGTWYRYNGTATDDGTSFTVNNTTDTYNLPASASYLFTNFPAEPCNLVYKSTDSGPGSLRYALSCALPGDTIRFSYPVLTDTLHLQSPLTVDKNIVILGQDEYPLVITAANADRAIHILPGVSCELSQVQLFGGNLSSGSCIQNEGSLIANGVQCFKGAQPAPASLLLNMSGASVEYRGTNQIK